MGHPFYHSADTVEVVTTYDNFTEEQTATVTASAELLVTNMSDNTVWISYSSASTGKVGQPVLAGDQQIMDNPATTIFVNTPNGPAVVYLTPGSVETPA